MVVASRSSTAERALLVVAGTLVTLAVLALIGFLLVPRLAPPVAPVAAPSSPTTVVMPVPTGASSGSSSPASSGSGSGSDSGSGGYSCGSTGGYDIWVNNGTVPCTSARMVTQQWVTYGTTPMSGEGPAGTPYSWTCSGATSSVGLCTSRMGSTFSISD